MINLRSNEHPSRHVTELTNSYLTKADLTELIGQYPNYTSFTRQLADACSIDPDRVLIGPGSDAIIRALGQYCLAQYSTHYFAEPMYVRYSEIKELAGPRARTYPATELPDPSSVRKKSVVYVESPHGTSGKECTELQQLCNTVAIRHGLTIVDCAYRGFLRPFTSEIHGAQPDSVSVFTFSKAMGLAGLRIALAIGPPQIIAELSRFCLHNDVSALAMSIAMLLISDTQFQTQVIYEHAECRREFVSLLESTCGSDLTSTAANFVLLSPHGFTAPALVTALADRQIATKVVRLGDCNVVRITVPPRALMPIVAERLSELHAHIRHDDIV